MERAAFALYDFEAERDTEITIKEGDRLYIVSQLDDGWSEVRKDSNGAIGYVPTAYIEESETSTTAEPEVQVRSKKDPRPTKVELKYNRTDATKLLIANMRTYLKAKRLHEYELTKEFKNSRFKNERIREIYATEQDYVKHLGIMVSKYLEPLRPSATNKNNLLNEQKHKAIFSNLSQILSVNQLLLADLKAEMEKWPNHKIFACFKKVAPFLITYTTYINNYDNAFNTVTVELQKNQKFKDYCTQTQADPETERHPITSFLIMPIQRLPRYKMLLEEMVQKSILPDDHVEKNDLTDAYNKASTIATGVNERKRADENSQTLLQLSQTLKSSLTNPYQSLVQPNRTLVREGVVKVRCSSKDFIIDEYKATLCTDVLILMQHNSKIKDKRKNTYYVFLSFTQLRTGSDNASDFTLEVINNGTTLIYTLVVPDPKEKKEWVNDLNECMETQKKAKMLRLGNKNIDLIQVSPIRTAASDKVKQTSATFQNLKREYEGTEKKLANLNEELKMNYILLKKLQEDIKAQEEEVVRTEQGLTTMEKQQVDVNKVLNENLAVVLEHDTLFMEALKDEVEAFKIIFGEGPTDVGAFETMKMTHLPRARSKHTSMIRAPSGVVYDLEKNELPPPVQLKQAINGMVKPPPPKPPKPDALSTTNPKVQGRLNTPPPIPSKPIPQTPPNMSRGSSAYSSPSLPPLPPAKKLPLAPLVPNKSSPPNTPSKNSPITSPTRFGQAFSSTPEQDEKPVFKRVNTQPQVLQRFPQAAPPVDRTSKPQIK